MEPTRDFAQLQLAFVDQIQWRYELIRPLVLFADRTAAARAAETHTHPETVGKLKRQFEQQGMLGLVPDTLEVVQAGRRRRVSAAVIEELARLKGLYTGFQYRELARIIFYKVGERVDPKTIKTLWQHSPLPTPAPQMASTPQSPPTRYQVRVQAIKLYVQGWSKVSISRFFHVAARTVTAWIRRFEAEEFAGLVDRSRAPKTPARKVWLPLMLEVYHLQKRHPDAGGFRIWSLLARTDVSVRTIERIMALNRQLYDDIPQGRRKAPQKDPTPHPYKATTPHEFWFIDGRKMAFALDGVKWWSLIILEGYSRTMLAGVVAPTEASWVALMVLYTAVQRYGVPKTLISDHGGAFISHAFEAVCTRLGIHHEPITGRKGESYKNFMETHFNIQRRLYDYQFSLTQTPADFERVHHTFLETYNTTAHQGLLKEQFDPPIPLQVLGEAKGRLYTPEELSRKFSRALFPRTTNRYGCVTLHHYHFYVEEGVPQTPVLLWVYGEQLRAVLENVVVAEYSCKYDWRTQKVTDIRDGVFYTTRFTAPQGVLIPLQAQQPVVLYRPTLRRRPVQHSSLTQQLWLFELVHPA